MNRKRIGTTFLAVLLVPVWANAQKPYSPALYSDEAEQAQLERLASDLGLELGEVERSGSERNFVGVRSEGLLISRRLDSRTFFIQNTRYGAGRTGPGYSGSDRELLAIAHEILYKLKVPAEEVDEPTILRELVQAASRDPKTGKVEVGEVEKAGRHVRVGRRVEGLPVFSSGLKLSVAEDGQVGFMELHWPEIPRQVIHEAHRLAYKLENGWRPPEQKAARVESVEAGIRHSSATGLLMDIYPVIRVVYAPLEEGIGRKPTLYFDRHGQTVPNPREFEELCPTDVKARQRE